MALSRFGGMWTYANATPLTDIPRADEAALKVTWQRGHSLMRYSDDSLLSSCSNAGMYFAVGYPGSRTG